MLKSTACIFKYFGFLCLNRCHSGTNGPEQEVFTNAPLSSHGFERCRHDLGFYVHRQKQGLIIRITCNRHSHNYPGWMEGYKHGFPDAG